MTVRLPKDESKNISEAGDIARIMQKVLLRQNKHHRAKEYFWTIGLNRANDIEYIELVTIGTQNRNILAPAEVLSLAVAKKCLKIVCCHNHPSGNLVASEADIALTETLAKAATILGMELLDHIIITEEDYVSIWP
ncbi:MAG: JAB domain-containing protein [Bacteroidota bacterium]